ncbi:MAG TPA: serine protease [Candidatus Paceibacterota bacterium]|nr:serine protease [Candidatus Paceibacterota bacterium]
MNTSQIIEENEKSIILIDIQKSVNSMSTVSIRGTGFIISKDGKFITCAHVYNMIPSEDLGLIGASVPSKTDEKGILHYNRYPIELIDKDDKNDIALMQIVSDKKDFNYIKDFGEIEKTKAGEDLLFIGYPLATELLSSGFGITMTSTRCIISSIKRRGIDGSLDFFIVDTHANNGSSGSPVFSSETGKVMGLVSGKVFSAKIPNPDTKQIIEIPANMGICRPAEYISEIINKNSK